MAYYNGNYRAGQRAPQQGMRMARHAGAMPNGARGGVPDNARQTGASCGCAQNNAREAAASCGCAQNNARETGASCGCAQNNAREAAASCGCAQNNAREAAASRGCAQNNAREAAASRGCESASSTSVNCIVPSPSCPVAMAYVPFQRFEELFDEGKAFTLGTAFPSLFKPFMAGGKCR